MKRRFVLPPVSTLVTILILTACRKEVTPTTQEEILSTPLPGQTTYCRIESLWEHPHEADQRFFLVLYNEFENPTVVTIPLPTTGHPYRTFKYDHWNRLREYRGEYANGFFEFWHFYGFDNNGRIGVDTTYTFGKLGEKPTEYFDRCISFYEYDAQGRIIHITTSCDRGANFMNNYTYDSNGNLVYPPAFGITYDNKMNLNRTNDIWQFLNRDYSMNNPFIATEYNGTGFPTKINTTANTASMLWLNEVDLRRSQIGYSCRSANF